MTLQQMLDGLNLLEYLGLGDFLGLCRSVDSGFKLSHPVFNQSKPGPDLVQEGGLLHLDSPADVGHAGDCLFALADFVELAPDKLGAQHVLSGLVFLDLLLEL